MSSNLLTARSNLVDLSQNTYPGRGIVLGQNHNRQLFQIYWIMGRSPDSRNRVFDLPVCAPEDVSTKLADPNQKSKDMELTIYRAMTKHEGMYIVSNGHQTDAVRHILDIKDGLPALTYEPDKPNNTNRITGVFNPTPGRVGSYDMHLLTLRKSALESVGEQPVPCERIHWSLADHTTQNLGFGFCITTYAGDGNPIPAFRGDPILVPVQGEIEDVGQMFWSALNEDNRVAIVVKGIDPNTHETERWVKCKYPEVPLQEPA